MKNLSGTNFRVSPTGARRMDASCKRLLASLALATLIATPAWAASRTVTLAVPGMTCAACPITVKMALSRVEGVSKTAVNFDKREAIVTFDDAKTSVEALSKASENAGYPASLKE